MGGAGLFHPLKQIPKSHKAYVYIVDETVIGALAATYVCHAEITAATQVKLRRRYRQTDSLYRLVYTLTMFCWYAAGWKSAAPDGADSGSRIVGNSCHFL